MSARANRIAFGALVLLAGLGCSGQQPVSCHTDELQLDRMIVAGERGTLTVGVSTVCTGAPQKGPMADQVTVEVLDPSGVPFAHEQSAPMQTGSFGSFQNVVNVSFTPDRTGSWLVIANFEPAIGQSQQRVEVVRQVTDAGFQLIPWTLPGDCRQFDLTDRGTLICLSNREVATTGQRIKGFAFAHDHDDLWRVASLDGGPAGLERLVDDGGVFQSANVSSEAVGWNGALLARGGDAWLFAIREYVPGDPPDPYFLLQAHPEPDGGLSIHSTPISRGGAPENGTLVPVGVAVTDAGVLLWSQGTCQCTGVSCGGCDRFLLVRPDGGIERAFDPGIPVGTDDETFWSLSGANGTPNRWALTAASAGASGFELATFQLPSIDLTGSGLPLTGFVGDPLSFPWETRFGAFTPVIPMSPIAQGDVSLRPRKAVPRFDGVTLTLEHYDVGEGYAEVSGATKRHAFARSFDGKTMKVIDR